MLIIGISTNINAGVLGEKETSIVLRMLALGIKTVFHFKFISLLGF